MPDWIDSPEELLVLISIITAFLGGLIWLIKAVNAIHIQTKPNGGSSMRDSLDRIENRLDSINHKIDGHIDWHMDKEK